MTNATNSVSVPNAGGNLEIKLKFVGHTSFRVYRCVRQGSDWVVDTTLEANGHGDSNAPASYSCSPPPVGDDILIYVQLMMSALVVPADVSVDIWIGRGPTQYSNSHVPAHVTATAVPADARVQLNGT